MPILAAVVGMTVGLAGIGPAAAYHSMDTELLSVGMDGKAASVGTWLGNSVSEGGRFAAFASYNPGLVPGDTNSVDDVFVRDRVGRTTERVSVSSTGTQGNAASGIADITSDGRYVAFNSNASNLVAGDTNGLTDVFVRDRQAGTTERVSISSSGAQGTGPLMGFRLSHISRDGRFVVFSSDAPNLVAGDTNGLADTFLRDRQSGTTERVSISSGSAQALGGESNPSDVSADGRFILFTSEAMNLVAGDTNGVSDLFIRDRQSGVTRRVGLSVQTGGALSSDGQIIAFASTEPQATGDTNGTYDAYVRDERTGTTEIASVSSEEMLGNGGSGGVSLSADGRFVAFVSEATNLVPDDTNGFDDVFVRDRVRGLTERISLSSDEAQADSESPFTPSISPDGRYVGFVSSARFSSADSSPHSDDLYLRDRDTCPSGNRESHFVAQTLHNLTPDDRQYSCYFEDLGL